MLFKCQEDECQVIYEFGWKNASFVSGGLLPVYYESACCPDLAFALMIQIVTHSINKYVCRTFAGSKIL